MPGPPPKAPENRARTNATIAMRRLPAEGRRGQQPGWPLAADLALTVKRDIAREDAAICLAQCDELEGVALRKAQRKYEAAAEVARVLDAKLKASRTRERELWNSIWKTPQAVAWEQLGWTRDVAMYVRHTVLAEQGDLDQAKEARQWSDRLGLSPMAMLRLRWEIAADEVADQRTTHAPADAGGARARRAARTLRAVGE